MPIVFSSLSATILTRESHGFGEYKMLRKSISKLVMLILLSLILGVLGTAKAQADYDPAIQTPELLHDEARSYDANNGPVRVVCKTCTGSERIVTSLRVIWKEPGFRTSYSEMMGLPNPSLSTTCWFPWYNNLFANTIMDQGFRISTP